MDTRFLSDSLFTLIICDLSLSEEKYPTLQQILFSFIPFYNSFSLKMQKIHCLRKLYFFWRQYIYIYILFHFNLRKMSAFQFLREKVYIIYIYARGGQVNLSGILEEPTYSWSTFCQTQRLREVSRSICVSRLAFLIQTLGELKWMVLRKVTTN